MKKQKVNLGKRIFLDKNVVLSLTEETLIKVKGGARTLGEQTCGVSCIIICQPTVALSCNTQCVTVSGVTC